MSASGKGSLVNYILISNYDYSSCIIGPGRLDYNHFYKYQHKSFDSNNCVIWTDLLVCYMDRDMDNAHFVDISNLFICKPHQCQNNQ